MGTGDLNTLHTMGTGDLIGVTWRKSSYSGDAGRCVEVAELADGSIAIRNSNHPQRGTVFLTSAEMAAFLKGVEAGEFNDLTS
jgi:hypothetical protein